MSDYDLPPISTLSAALVGESQSSLDIAPELLEDTSHQSNNQDLTTNNHGEMWTGEWPNAEAGASGAAANEQLQLEDGDQPARKKARPSRRRDMGPMSHADFANYLNGATNAEYEDPGRDFRGGAVFTYPPSGSNQACMRCHQIKRKCDNLRPRCSTCSKSDFPCVFEMSAATAGFVANMKNEHYNTTSQLQVVQQRVSELETLLGSGPSTSNQNPHDQHISYSNGQNGDPSSSVFTNPISESDYTGFAQHLLGLDHEHDNGFAAADQETSLPSLSVARKAAEAFFEYDLVIPLFLNKGEFMVDLEDIWDPNARSSVGKRHAFIVYMVTSVGAHVCEAVKTMDAGISEILRQRAIPLLGQAVSKQDLISVQAYLALLSSALFGLHPDTSPTSVLSLALQTAISLGLHRKHTLALKPDTELRNRIWWTIYCHDRSLGAGLGRPLGIAGGEISAELPQSDHESPSEKTRYHLIERVIGQRTLLGRLHTTFSDSARTTESLAAGIKALEAEILEWQDTRTHPNVGNEETIHLLDAQLQCLLIRPSTLDIGSESASAQMTRVCDSTSKALAILSSTRAADRPARDLLSKIWRLRLCTSHLYAMAEEARLSTSSLQSSRVMLAINTCREVIASCDIKMKETKHLERALEKLVKYVLSQCGSRSVSSQTEDEKERREILSLLYGPFTATEEEKGEGRTYDAGRVKRVLAEMGESKDAGSSNSIF